MLFCVVYKKPCMQKVTESFIYIFPRKKSYIQDRVLFPMFLECNQ